MKPHRPLRVLAVLGMFVFASAASAQQADVIRGRVTNPDSLPIEGAQVTVTSLSGNVSRNARTDRNGRYTVTFPGGDGDYFVNFAAIGYAPRRFEIKRMADEDILVADAHLLRSGSQLDAVKVIAPRDKVARADAPPDISGTEKPVNNSALTAAQQGDLAAMAASLPGVLLVPGADGDPSGFSVLGLGTDQNNTTLNGMNFGGSNLPRDAAVSTSLVTAPYDVSRGGFSGGQLNVRGRPGSNFITRASSLNVDAPQLQWTDPAGSALGQQYTNLSLGGGAAGPLKFDHAFYNVSYQLGRRSNDLQTPLNTGALGLETAGIASDSVQRLLGILKQAHIPSTVGGFPGQRLNDNGLLFGSFDIAPPTSRTGQSFNFVTQGGWNRANPVLTQVTELPAHGGELTNWNGTVQAHHTAYFGFGILTESGLAFGESQRYGSPFLALPSGQVRVNSTFADGSNGVKTFSFGGSPSLNTGLLTKSIDLTNQLSWFSLDNKHRLKFTSEIRRDDYTMDQTSNQLGTFSFNSLADLEAGRPSSFTRALQPRKRSGGVTIGSLSLGDSYRRSSALQLQYGVRLDGNYFDGGPRANPVVEQLFGTRNDNIPNRVYASPRIGFSWTYGTAAQVGGFEGAARAPRAVVRGGVGLFQNGSSAQLLGTAVDNTGLPGALQQLTCIGAAAPTPDWNTYLTNSGAVPSQCADGSSGTVFASNVPNVVLFSRNYAAARSLRSNLQWNGAVLGNRFNAQAEVTYSLNMNQPGAVDLNFRPTVRFNLADESGRPVYVLPTSIDATTGAIAARDARVSQLFNRVTEQRSDLKSDSRQFRVSLSPTAFSTNFSWNVTYLLSDIRERVRGFSSTVGNPLDVEWSKSGFNTRHQIQYSLFYNLFDFVRLSWSGGFRSGVAYTPSIFGDVNGDGYATNDRAFVYDPSRTADPALASSMRTLIASSSGNARRCLEQQMGKLAARNSCEGPWTTSANLGISFNPIKVGMPQRATISFQLSNPLGAADLLMHGENRLRGWGQTLAPDQNLLYVRGFDQTTQRFRYEVNQRFGSTSPATSAIRSPVTLTAMMRFDVGPTRERQNLTQQMDRGRRTQGQKLPEALLRAIYGSGGIVNPMATILRQSDTLRLTGKQADSLATLNRWYIVHLDSIWSPVSKYLATLPDRYDEDEAYARYRKGREASVDLLLRIAPDMKRLLTAEQRRKLPPLIASYLDPRYLSSIRSGTAGAGGAQFTPGGGLPLPAGGGGTTVTIVR